MGEVEAVNFRASRGGNGALLHPACLVASCWDARAVVGLLSFLLLFKFMVKQMNILKGGGA